MKDKNEKEMTDEQILEAMLDWFQDPVHWTQGRTGRLSSATGKPMYSCLGGAYGVVLHNLPLMGAMNNLAKNGSLAYRTVADVITEQFPERFAFESIPAFNDHRDTRIEDIRLVLEKALADVRMAEVERACRSGQK